MAERVVEVEAVAVRADDDAVSGIFGHGGEVFQGYGLTLRYQTGALSADTEETPVERCHPEAAVLRLHDVMHEGAVQRFDGAEMAVSVVAAQAAHRAHEHLSFPCLHDMHDGDVGELGAVVGGEVVGDVPCVHVDEVDAFVEGADPCRLPDDGHRLHVVRDVSSLPRQQQLSQGSIGLFHHAEAAVLGRHPQASVVVGSYFAHYIPHGHSVVVRHEPFAEGRLVAAFVADATEIGTYPNTAAMILVEHMNGIVDEGVRADEVLALVCKQSLLPVPLIDTRFGADPYVAVAIVRGTMDVHGLSLRVCREEPLHLRGER